MLTEIVVLLSVVLNILLTHWLTRSSRKVEEEKTKLEIEKLRRELEAVKDTQLMREVVFNKEDDEPYNRLYWIDNKGVGHLITDPDVALLFATQKGFIGISKDQIENLKKGRPVSAISRDSFCRIEHNYFVIIDDKLFYLSSLTPVFKYWDDIKSVREISLNEFRQYQIFR